jgi:hypothetical protein
MCKGHAVHMNRSTSRSSIAALAAIAALLVLAVVASGVFGRTAQPGPSDPPASDAPSPSPVVTPAPSYIPSEVPSDEPSEAPSEAPEGLVFDLDVATPHDVSVEIDDQTGRITGARSGRAGDGMSVRWGDSIVENVDDDTLRITWVGLPQDDTVQITVSQDGDTFVIDIDQAAPPANSDAMGHDRVIEVSFDAGVAADDVEVSVSN